MLSWSACVCANETFKKPGQDKRLRWKKKVKKKWKGKKRIGIESKRAAIITRDSWWRDTNASHSGLYCIAMAPGSRSADYFSPSSYYQYTFVLLCIRFTNTFVHLNLCTHTHVYIKIQIYILNNIDKFTIHSSKDLILREQIEQVFDFWQIYKSRLSSHGEKFYLNWIEFILS